VLILEGTPLIYHFLRVAKPGSAGHLAQAFIQGEGDAPVSNNETDRNLLTYALAIAGDERLLAERLGVTIPHVLNWTTGIERIPTEIFLKAVDVVLASTAEDIRRSRETLYALKYRDQRAANQSQLLSRDAPLDTSERPSAQGNAEGLSGEPDS
jgi:hypothetical protein